MGGMLAACQGFYDEEEGAGAGNWVFVNTVDRKDVVGKTQEQWDEKAETMNVNDVGRMFMECGLDCSEFAYYKGTKAA